ncbi:11983_t:CDS:1, partial [Ambispora gerdemannii]
LTKKKKTNHISEIRVEAGDSSSVQVSELIIIEVEEINPELINMEVEKSIKKTCNQYHYLESVCLPDSHFKHHIQQNTNPQQLKNNT